MTLKLHNSIPKDPYTKQLCPTQVVLPTLAHSADRPHLQEFWQMRRASSRPPHSLAQGVPQAGGVAKPA